MPTACDLQGIFMLASGQRKISIFDRFCSFFSLFFRHNGNKRGFEIRFHAYLLLTGDHFRDMRVTRREIVHGTGMGSFSLNRL